MAGGIQSDPRVHFAAERTFLAWMRTGLAFMGFGFVVARFGLFLRELAAVHSGRVVRPTRFSMVVGTGLILIGVLVNIAAAINHVQLIRELRKESTIRDIRREWRSRSHCCSPPPESRWRSISC